MKEKTRRNKQKRESRNTWIRQEDRKKSEAVTIETRRRKKNDIFKKRSESVTEMKETEQIYSLKKRHKNSRDSYFLILKLSSLLFQ